MTLIKNDFAYPIMLNLTNKKCVIIGGGSVAARKLTSLLKAKAAVTVIAPEFCAELISAGKNANCTLINDVYHSRYLADAFLTVAATDNKEVNRTVTNEAPFLCNNITEPELSNFTVPSVIEQGNITLAIATGGIPAYTRLLKKYLTDKLHVNFAEFNEFLYTIRQEVKQIPSTPKERTDFWRQSLTPEIITLLESGNISEAKEKILDAVNSFRAQS